MSIQPLRLTRVNPLEQHNPSKNTDALYQPLRHIIYQPGAQANELDLSTSRLQYSRYRPLSRHEAEVLSKELFIPANEELIPTHNYGLVKDKHFRAINVEEKTYEAMSEQQFRQVHASDRNEQIVYELPNNYVDDYGKVARQRNDFDSSLHKQFASIKSQPNLSIGQSKSANSFKVAQNYYDVYYDQLHEYEEYNPLHAKRRQSNGNRLFDPPEQFVPPAKPNRQSATALQTNNPLRNIYRQTTTDYDQMGQSPMQSPMHHNNSQNNRVSIQSNKRASNQAPKQHVVLSNIAMHLMNQERSSQASPNRYSSNMIVKNGPSLQNENARNSNLKTGDTQYVYEGDYQQMRTSQLQKPNGNTRISKINSAPKSYKFKRELSTQRGRNKQGNPQKYNLFSIIDEPINKGLANGFWKSNEIIAAKTPDKKWQ